MILLFFFSLEDKSKHRETLPLQTSDMGKKTVLVLAHSFYNIKNIENCANKGIGWVNKIKVNVHYGGGADTNSDKHTDRHTHQYQDSAWRKGQAL